MRSESKQVLVQRRAGVTESCGMHSFNVGAGRLRQETKKDEGKMD